MFFMYVIECIYVIYATKNFLDSMNYYFSLVYKMYMKMQVKLMQKTKLSGELTIGNSLKIHITSNSPYKMPKAVFSRKI